MSRRSHINPQNLTPTQKIELARNRIWGNYVGGNYASGFKYLEAPSAGRAKGNYYEFHNLKMIYPFIDDWEKQNKLKEKYELRKNRIFMRGIKIGAKRGGDSNTSMSVFEQSKRQEQ